MTAPTPSTPEAEAAERYPEPDLSLCDSQRAYNRAANYTADSRAAYLQGRAEERAALASSSAADKDKAAVEKLAWRFQSVMSRHLVIDDDEILGVGKASYEMARTALTAGLASVDRDALGREVRKAWVRWAEQQPHSKPSWLVPYDELSELDKEADRQIGEHIYALAAGHAAVVENPETWTDERVWAEESGVALHVEADDGRVTLTIESPGGLNTATIARYRWERVVKAALASFSSPAAAVDVPCRFAEKGCTSPAAAVLYVPAGCHCWPDPVQALCHQHIETCESTGPITTIVDLDRQEILGC